MFYLTPIIDDFFENFFRNFDNLTNHISTLTAHYSIAPDYPVSNIGFMRDGSLIFELAVTGYNKDELDISVEKDILTICGKKQKQQNNDKEIKFIHKKLVCKSFNISYNIPDKYDLDNVSVVLKNGLLTITIPLKPEIKAQRRTLQITEG